MKNKTTTALLALFLGGIFGVHKFYLGKIWQGVLYILFNWTLIPFIISIIEFFIFITMSDEKFNIKYNSLQSHSNKIQKESNENITIKYVTLEEAEKHEKELQELKKIVEQYKPITNDELDDDDFTYTYDEIIAFVDSVVKEESKERQKAEITRQNEIVKSHKCSIHNKPINYAFKIEGLSVEVHIIEKCCEQSSIELMKKLRN